MTASMPRRPTGTDLAPRPPVPSPTRIGQGTAIEQSRVAAEVHARVVVAQQVPRRIDLAEREMHAACARQGLAERAFYKYPRSDKTVQGETIHLARELARCWGNVDYGAHELRRDDELGQSEMLVWAWDLQTNTRSGQIFIVPHARDLKSGDRKALVALRDIYENNANMGARRLRESIFSILPPWFTEDAKAACMATLQAGDGTALAERVGNCLANFAKLGVREPVLVQKIGRPAKAWTVLDLAHLTVSYRSIERGEVSVDEEFDLARVTAADITAVPQVSASPPVEKQETPAEQAPPEQAPPAVPATPMTVSEGDDGWPAARRPPDAAEPTP